MVAVSRSAEFIMSDSCGQLTRCGIRHEMQNVWQKEILKYRSGFYFRQRLLLNNAMHRLNH